MSDHDVKKADLVIDYPGGPREGPTGCDGLPARYLQPGFDVDGPLARRRRVGASEGGRLADRLSAASGQALVAR
jgi:hypothetical protein